MEQINLQNLWEEYDEDTSDSKDQQNKPKLCKIDNPDCEACQ